MKTVTLEETQALLPEWLEEIESGEEILITVGGKMRLRITAFEKPVTTRKVTFPNFREVQKRLGTDKCTGPNPILFERGLVE